ncbi:Coproporphyrinogen III oxidase, oxygen-independent [Fulvivirga imtechensis AK7]|uniref:Coproporphyrinogen-III oxidase n=1 Tax=Fulvivirga imtechensis AK7 TaxID=1237149 RepID=L8JT26_9BACT|nr:oxygen-independent coproporphyrinogen III oxidase [Fulvivirga imtechensis]ELR72000.1 Coproporphyrinogen III oxidase, oxygen-independent [Fulvivirga imtechensis AK7]
MTTQELIKKYNVPAPRYTSYPTVPMWEEEKIGTDAWMRIVKKTFVESNREKGISLYIHLPFCESLCTYCGCNTRITKNHKVETGYIEALHAEWQMYVDSWEDKPVIRELHLGGGTPTFFSPENLQLLLQGILEKAKVHSDHEFSFEGHPNNTTEAHLQTLYDLGFSRVSFGIQDLDLKVQQAINRIQPYENVKTATEAARRVGYTSVNFDLIYGLPFQTPESVSNTIDQVGQLMPERIAFYSYAHVPWIKPAQRGYSEADLPSDENKRKLYELGKEKFVRMGYKDIGMDHFALPHDVLYQAAENDTLHRNFMGYTTCNTDLLLGLGTSSISDAKYGYMQNLKVVEKYKQAVLEGQPAILKGHIMTAEDLLLKKHILELLCTGQCFLGEEIIRIIGGEAIVQLHTMRKEGLLTLNKSLLKVTDMGKAFIRNIAMVFDMRLKRAKAASEPVFSKAI